MSLIKAGGLSCEEICLILDLLGKKKIQQVKGRRAKTTPREYGRWSFVYASKFRRRPVQPVVRFSEPGPAGAKLMFNVYRSLHRVIVSEKPEYAYTSISAS